MPPGLLEVSTLYSFEYIDGVTERAYFESKSGSTRIGELVYQMIRYESECPLDTFFHTPTETGEEMKEES